MTRTDNHNDAETGLNNLRPVSPYKAGFSCVCPNCGKGPLYKNLLDLKDRCDVCDFDLSSADAGDGAQVFAILILGAICAILGFFLYALNLPDWAIVLTLFWVIMVGTIWMLRVFKATLVALQFFHDAHEGSINSEDDS
ncbi:DUF983 domain-containing protein [Kordiimonas pumila]|uniref:DUF983 domain-containing protein n=1 Tax=Kordiimonas pumila TaxID=2161677 RepID=A0ABV7D965_9PROT|nr:DUF983 domain-containing protein [Kordiimonas pumila]